MGQEAAAIHRSKSLSDLRPHVPNMDVLASKERKLDCYYMASRNRFSWKIRQKASQILSHRPKRTKGARVSGAKSTSFFNTSSDSHGHLNRSICFSLVRTIANNDSLYIQTPSSIRIKHRDLVQSQKLRLMARRSFLKCLCSSTLTQRRLCELQCEAETEDIMRASSAVMRVGWLLGPYTFKLSNGENQSATSTRKNMECIYVLCMFCLLPNYR